MGGNLEEFEGNALMGLWFLKISHFKQLFCVDCI